MLEKKRKEKNIIKILESSNKKNNIILCLHQRVNWFKSKLYFYNLLSEDLAFLSLERGKKFRSTLALTMEVFAEFKFTSKL